MKPNIRARRRVRLRSALLLVLAADLLMMAARLFTSRNSAGAWIFTRGVIMEALVSLLAFGGGSYLGLYVLDGDHRRMVPRRNLSQAQILWLALLGAALIFPVTLLSDLFWYLFDTGRPLAGVDYAAFVKAPGADFLPRLLKSALLAPVLEELFFRGYLYGALKRYGERAAMAATALCFALVHFGTYADMDGSLLLYTIIGALLTLVMNRTGSITAAMLVHGCYNLALILCDYSGLDILFYGLSPVSCSVRLLGCAAFVYVLKRAWVARAARPREAEPPERFGRREKALLIASCAAVICASLLLS